MSSATPDDDCSGSHPNDNTMGGAAIGSLMASKGPVVQGVLLRCHPSNDTRKPAAAPGDAKTKPELVLQLAPLVEQVSVDTTPSKMQAASLLGGGPVTFVGQFPTEGTVVVARRALPDDLGLGIANLRQLCREYGVDTTGMVEKADLVQALTSKRGAINPHPLQPPLDGIVVRGDLLLLKVADQEDDDDDDDDPQAALLAAAQLPMDNNDDEFFLDYTKEEYLKFAVRTDIVAPVVEEEEDDDDNEDEKDDDDDEHDEDFVLGQDGDDDEDNGDDEDLLLTLHVVVAQLIKRFRTEHGRGPSSKELLEIRSQVAETLGLEVTSFEDVATNDDHDKKRSAAAAAAAPNHKRVKFDPATKADEHCTTGGGDNDNKKAEASQPEDHGGKKPAAK